MRLLIILAVIAVVLVGIGAAAYRPIAQSLKKWRQPDYREEEVDHGPITEVVNATGTVQPVLRVQVGAFVSGPIIRLHVDFNDEVKKDELLAEIDPQLYDAAVARDQATLLTRKADVARAKAQLEQSTNDLNRAKALRRKNKDYISDAEMDQFRYSRLSLLAQLRVAENSVKQAEANLKNSQTNLGYTEIRAPEDGIVIDRKIDKGQTLASQFQTPELFVVAPQMREKMHIHASVDEADIGLIRRAEEHGRPVRFTVDAYPDDLFEGKIKQIRFSSATTQNVVTYPVIVEAPNPDLKLLPGMTANLSFEIEKKDDVLRIPNAALRFYPKREQVHEDDRLLLDGKDEDESQEEAVVTDDMRSAMERAEAAQRRSRRHVWLFDGEFLRATEIETGISDNQYTEVVAGEITKGQKLVAGIKPKKP